MRPAGFVVRCCLDRVEKHKSFVYGEARLRENGGRLTLDVELRHRANARPKCSGCVRPRPGYDTLPARRFEWAWLLYDDGSSCCESRFRRMKGFSGVRNLPGIS